MIIGFNLIFNFFCLVGFSSQLDGKECVWSAIDYSTEESGRRTFRAQFSSAAAALEFQSIFSEVLKSILKQKNYYFN